MKFAFPNSGLYAITETENVSRERLYETTEAILRGGAGVLQFRDKTHHASWQRTTGRRLLEICHQYCAPFIVNDDVDLAYDLGADGVHLGKDDQSIEAARKTLGSNAIIGISCYASLDRALSAEKNGATYITFGRFFTSVTKPGAIPTDPKILNYRSFRIPVVAIGGITSSNGKILLEAGADLLAVISALSAHPDPEQSACDFQRLFRERFPNSPSDN